MPVVGTSAGTVGVTGGDVRAEDVAVCDVAAVEEVAVVDAGGSSLVPEAAVEARRGDDEPVQPPATKQVVMSTIAPVRRTAPWCRTVSLHAVRDRRPVDNVSFGRTLVASADSAADRQGAAHLHRAVGGDAAQARLQICSSRQLVR